MQKTSNHDPIYIKPTVIEDYQEFRFYAKRAKLVIFETQYYEPPFTDPSKIEPAQYLKALKVWAFGVYVDQRPHTLTHTIRFSWLPPGIENWRARIKTTNRRLATLIEDLEADLQAIQNTPSSPSTRELWVKTLG
jgi:hypothetical protein